MHIETIIPSAKVDELYVRLYREAEAGGYHLNADQEFTRDLLKGLLTTEERYGYRACPCRLVADDRQQDLDIVCPCDYGDADLIDWGACDCALHVATDVLRGNRAPEPVPERWPDG